MNTAQEKNIIAEYGEKWAEKLEGKLHPLEIVKLFKDFDILIMWGVVHSDGIKKVMLENNVNPQEFLEYKIKLNQG